MNVGPQHESAVKPGGPAGADVVSFNWVADDGAWCGMARLGMAKGADPPVGSALAVLFRGSEPLGIHAEGNIEIPAASDWRRRVLPGLQTSTAAPLERWSVRHDGDGYGFDLIFDAIGPPAGIDESHPVGDLGGMDRYEQRCSFNGRVWDADGLHEVSGLGQRGHAWGQADWDALQQTRTLSMWLGEEEGGVILSSLRPAGVESHDTEPTWCELFTGGEAVEVTEPRLSTTYDSEGRQHRAGLELWVGEEDEYPLRASGHAVCGASIDLGALRVELAFMRWSAEGREGYGRYEIVRPTAGA